MTIGIFGDSYALDYPNSWISCLSTNINKEFTNYSVGGSSFDYSYHQFRKYNHLHNMIIFVVTSTSRGSIFTTKNNRILHLAFYQNSSIADLKSMNNDEDVPSTFSKPAETWNKRLIKTIKGEINKSVYYDSNIMYHTAYLDSIKYLRPDAHIIFAFDFPTLHYGSMFNISKIDYNNLNLPEDEDFRPCHMSYQQNIEFANYMQQHIETDFDIHSTMIKPERFYTASKNKEDANWI